MLLFQLVAPVLRLELEEGGCRIVKGKQVDRCAEYRNGDQLLVPKMEGFVRLKRVIRSSKEGRKIDRALVRLEKVNRRAEYRDDDKTV